MAVAGTGDGDVAAFYRGFLARAVGKHALAGNDDIGVLVVFMGHSFAAGKATPTHGSKTVNTAPCPSALRSSISPS